MGQIENTVEFTRKIEALLVEELRAEGRGLHEKVSSVERKLPGPLVKRLRYIASVRNKMMHDDYQLQEPEDFYAACEQTLRELGERIETQKSAAAAAVASGPVDSPASRLTPQAPITMQPLTVGVLIVVKWSPVDGPLKDGLNQPVGGHYGTSGSYSIYRRFQGAGSVIGRESGGGEGRSQAQYFGQDASQLDPSCA